MYFSFGLTGTRGSPERSFQSESTNRRKVLFPLALGTSLGFLPSLLFLHVTISWPLLQISGGKAQSHLSFLSQVLGGGALPRTHRTGNESSCFGRTDAGTRSSTAARELSPASVCVCISSCRPRGGTCVLKAHVLASTLSPSRRP